MLGETISHYTIVDKLGEGGMGIVYRARDTRLDRFVALKFLPRHLVGNEAEQARFLQEARAASALNHPHVCTIFDIIEEEDRQCIVMEYVDGAMLKEKCPVPKLPDALVYAVQIGEALQEAHAKGIVHRDIKSENIMVNGQNQVKVMDFGLAKLKGSLKLTRTSSTVGTLAYMAPEQIQGGEVDARSDIFSFGVVVFEMLTGHLPFRGEHEAAMMYSILNEEPESARSARPEVSPELDHIIHRTLEKDPEDRYQSVADILGELRREQKKTARIVRPSADVPVSSLSNSGSQAGRPVARPSKRTAMATMLVAGGLVVSLLVYFITRHPQMIDSLAVLPFENVGGDPNTEYLSDGITESLINGLSQLSHLSVRSGTSVFHYKGKGVDPIQAGRELGVKAVLVGKVSQRGENLQISTELVDVSSNNHIWGGTYSRKLSEILSVQEEISREMSRQLSIRLVGEEESKLARRPTDNTEAYQLYLKGKFYWNKRTAVDLRKAADFFTQAIDSDPKFALAYAGLASTYSILPNYSLMPAKDFWPRAEAAARKALELDGTLAEPHTVLASNREVYEWDWDAAEKEFKRALELDPNYPTAHHWYSNFLEGQGRLTEALAEIRRALELDPLSPAINANVGEVLFFLGRHDEAIEQFKKTLELDPQSLWGLLDLGYLYAQQNRFDDALRELRKVREIVGENSPYGLETLGYVYARAGMKDKAARVLDQLFEFSRGGHAVAYQIACVYAGLGDREKAFPWLEKASVERNPQLEFVKIDPLWDSLRSDPRFAALLKKMRLE